MEKLASVAQKNMLTNMVAERGLTMYKFPDMPTLTDKISREMFNFLRRMPRKYRNAAEARNAVATEYFTYLAEIALIDDEHGEARAVITRLQSLPDVPRQVVQKETTAPTAPIAPAEEISDGMYVKDGVVYKAQYAVNGSGRLYAKKFNVETKEFEYAGRAPLRFLTSADKMTLEQAGYYGKLYGRCMRCSKTLTDEYSIEHGYGKVCAGKI